MFGHVVRVGARKLRGFTVKLPEGTPKCVQFHCSICQAPQIVTAQLCDHSRCIVSFAWTYPKMDGLQWKNHFKIDDFGVPRFPHFRKLP